MKLSVAYVKFCDFSYNKDNVDKGLVKVNMDLNTGTITVLDNGCGFPARLDLLFLGGGTKQQLGNRKGKVGVGIKVCLFSSCRFSIRSNRGGNQTFKIEVSDADRFSQDCSLRVLDPPPSDPTPLAHCGTEIKYTFRPDSSGRTKIHDFIEELYNEFGSDFLSEVLDLFNNKTNRTNNTNCSSPIAYLLSCFLRRYTYVGDTFAAFHQNKQPEYPKNGIEIEITLICDNPSQYFSREISSLFAGLASQTFKVPSQYLTIEDTMKELGVYRTSPDTNVFINILPGPGGRNFSTTQGFNVVTLRAPDQYKLLLQRSSGDISTPKISKYETRLFPNINFLYFAIGRIPSFEALLPNGTQRIISCNGVPTKHTLSISRGRNQEYVRCLDLVIDVKADLNYGKTHITDNQLVGLINEYINEAYSTVLLNGISNWVGRVNLSLTGTGQQQITSRVARQNLGLADYAVFKEPCEEQDVIALFFEMLGRGVFGQRFLRSYGISSQETYDGRGLLLKPSNQGNFPNANDDSQLQTFEFKLRASDIVRDFEQGTKDISLIDLVVCWEYGNFSGQYMLSEVAQVLPRNLRSGIYHRVKKVICDSRGNYLQVLCLREIRDQIVQSQS